MGLLDQFFGSPDQTQALGLLGIGLMNKNFGGGAQAAMQHMAGAEERKARKQMLDMQMRKGLLEMEGLERENRTRSQLDEAARAAYVTPERANAMSMGPMPDGSNVPEVAPGFNPRAFLDRAYQIDPFKAIQLQQSLTKDKKPITVAPGTSLVDPDTYKPVFTAPKEHSAPSAVQEYEYAKGQGFKGSFADWELAKRRAGANSVSLSVNTEKSLLNDIAGGFGKGIVDAKGAAQASLGTINTVNRLMDALDSGKVMAGPGTTFRQTGLQLGQMLGVGGKSGQEVLINTRQAVQSLAQLELDAAQQMKGQGQITEAERAIIRRAASGDIDSMTVPELRLLGGVLDKTARFKIRGYNQQVKPLASNPNAAPIAPFLAVEEPAPRSAPNVLRFDAQGNLITN